jgi:glutathione S-transferase
VATLYRCPTPTDWLCRCGTVARRLRKRGIDFDQVRVPFPKSERPEVEELTGQRWVPVLVHGEEVIHDSHRILEYLDWLGERSEAADRGGSPEARAATAESSAPSGAAETPA